MRTKTAAGQEAHRGVDTLTGKAGGQESCCPYWSIIWKRCSPQHGQRRERRRKDLYLGGSRASYGQLAGQETGASLGSPKHWASNLQDDRADQLVPLARSLLSMPHVACSRVHSSTVLALLSPSSILSQGTHSLSNQSWAAGTLAYLCKCFIVLINLCTSSQSTC